MITTCQQCSKQIEQLGNKPKKFCSDKCRMAWNRTNGAQEVLSEQPEKAAEMSEGLPEGVSEREGKYWYKEKEVTVEGLEMLREFEQDPNSVYDRFTALQLHAMGFDVPKWKKFHKTKAEAINSLKDELEKKFGIEKIKKETDYSTWN